MSYRVSRCISCDDPSLEFRTAVVDPFVAGRAFQQPATICRVARCRGCGLVFFEDRFDESEAARLYADYRSEAYYRARHRWEPLYTRAVNAGLGGAAEMALRREVYHGILARYAPDAQVNTVLDYGGDRGQLMVGGPGRSHYVFDISGVEPEPGVIRIPGGEALGGRTFDLVLLCEVLEHLSDPARTLASVAAHVRPGGLLYVTVPNRDFPLTDIPTGAWYSVWLRLILRNRWTTIAADFWSGGVLGKLRRVPPLGFIKMHEHINFFDPISLGVMLRRAGLNVLACEPYRGGRGLVALCCRLAVRS